jgi:hypothetical protein
MIQNRLSTTVRSPKVNPIKQNRLVPEVTKTLTYRKKAEPVPGVVGCCQEQPTSWDVDRSPPEYHWWLNRLFINRLP